MFIPTLIDRTVASRNGRARLTNREFIYRSAFELGRHVIGYEVQKVLALVNALERECRDRGRELRVGIFGYGEGGAIALYAAALDPRIKAACVSGYLGDRNDVWRQPVDRNVFGLLEQFGDAEVASLDRAADPGRRGGQGARIRHPAGDRRRAGAIDDARLGTVTAEVERARALVAGLEPGPRLELVASGPDGTGPFGTDEALGKLLRGIDPAARLEPAGPDAAAGRRDPKAIARLIEAGRDRQERQLHELDRHDQQLLVESPYTRQAFMKKLDTRSADAYATVGRAVPGVLRRGGHRPVQPEAAAAGRPHRGGSTTSRDSPATRS